MRVLLDECLPRRLKAGLPGHGVITVSEARWAGKTDEELLRLIPGNFDVFVTIDQSMADRQRSSGLPFAVVVLTAPSGSFADLLPLAPQLLEELDRVSPGGSSAPAEE